MFCMQHQNSSVPPTTLYDWLVLNVVDRTAIQSYGMFLKDPALSKKNSLWALSQSTCCVRPPLRQRVREGKYSEAA